MQVFEVRNRPVHRDMDLIRELLIKMDADKRLDGQQWVMYNTPEEMGISGHSVEEVGYHLGMLVEEGFVKGVAGPEAMPVLSKITWKGHELLSDIRDDTIWEKAKERTKGLPEVGLQLIWEIAKAEIRAKLGLPG